MLELDLISRQEDNGQFEGHSKGGGPTDGSNGASLNENQLDHYRFNLDDIWYKRWQAIIRENDQLGRGECTTNEVNSQINTEPSITSDLCSHWLVTAQYQGCVSAGLGQQCAICYSSANHDNAKIVKYCSDWNVKEWDFCYANSVCECN